MLSALTWSLCDRRIWQCNHRMQDPAQGSIVRRAIVDSEHPRSCGPALVTNGRQISELPARESRASVSNLALKPSTLFISGFCSYTATAARSAEHVRCCHLFLAFCYDPAGCVRPTRRHVHGFSGCSTPTSSYRTNKSSADRKSSSPGVFACRLYTAFPIALRKYRHA
jgi:hypothetical protein